MPIHIEHYKGTDEIIKLNFQIRKTDLMDIIRTAILPDARGFEIYRAVLPANRVIEVLKNIK